MNKIQERTTTVLLWANSVTHIIISFALVMAMALITIYFFYEIYQAIAVHLLFKGFLHSLGTLLLLWTIAELISTEIKFHKAGDIEVDVFIEVALVVVVREIILLPVKETTPTFVEISVWVGASLFLGLTYLFVRLGKRNDDPTKSGAESINRSAE